MFTNVSLGKMGCFVDDRQIRKCLDETVSVV